MLIQHDYESLKEAIAELLLQVKVRSDEEINRYNKHLYNEEKQQCMQASGFDLVKMVKTCIEQLMDIESPERTVSNYVMRSNRDVIERVPFTQNTPCYSVLGTQREMLKRLNMVDSPSVSRHQTPREDSIPFPHPIYEQQLQQLETAIRQHI